VCGQLQFGGVLRQKHPFDFDIARGEAGAHWQRQAIDAIYLASIQYVTPSSATTFRQGLSSLSFSVRPRLNIRRSISSIQCFFHSYGNECQYFNRLFFLFSSSQPTEPHLCLTIAATRTWFTDLSGIHAIYCEL
jgi:hypothetical protein